MPSRMPPVNSDWSYVNGSDQDIDSSRFSTDTSATIAYCPTCRAVQPDVVAGRVRLAALVFFARQLQLEVEELANIFDVPLPAGGS